MGLDDYIPEIESSEWNGNSAEATREASEKFQEQAKKAGRKVAKVWKDEKKAKKYDFILAGFLVQIIVDKNYDSILDTLFPALHNGYPSNFILGILSLIHINISNTIRDTYSKERIQFTYTSKEHMEEFDDNAIDTEIKNRINGWIEDISDSVTIDYSHIQTQKLKELLAWDNTLLLAYISKVFIHFLEGININISLSKANNISEFILSEVKKSIQTLDVENI